MTVCIGAVCEDGKMVIVATDRLWTNPYLSIEYEYPEPKIERLSFNCVAAIAGSVVLPTEAFERVREEIGRKGIGNISEIAHSVKEEYIKERKKRVDDDVFKPRGLTIEDFYRGGMQPTLNPDLVRRLDIDLSEYRFDLEILIGGVDKKGHLYVVFPPGRVEPFERIGYVSIGSGASHAEYTFILNGYTLKATLYDALYTLYKAKKIAERATGVGASTDIEIATEKGSLSVSDNIKEELESTYESELKIVADKEQLLQKLKETIKKFREVAKI